MCHRWLLQFSIDWCRAYISISVSSWHFQLSISPSVVIPEENPSSWLVLIAIPYTVIAVASLSPLSHHTFQLSIIWSSHGPNFISSVFVMADWALLKDEKVPEEAASVAADEANTAANTGKKSSVSSYNTFEWSQSRWTSFKVSNVYLRCCNRNWVL